MLGVLRNPAAVFYGSFLRYFLGFSLNELISYDKLANGGLKNLLYFGNAHTAETYCAYVQSMSEDELVNTQRASKIGAVNCPVDVEIYDGKTGELVGRIKDNRVDEEIAAKENAVVMFVEGDEKRFWLPSGGDYKVVLTGNDSGKMDYTVSSVEGGDETTERLNYYDVVVSTGVSMTEEIGSALLDSRLLDAAGKEIPPDEVITDASEAKANVTVTTEGSGEVKGVGEYIRGDYVTLTARAMCSDFLGWYEGETLVSSEAKHRFKALGNVTLAAKFTEGSHAFEEVTEEATCMVGGYTANRCGNCGLTNILKETKPLGHKTVFNRGQQPTCTENGWKDYYTCSRCEYTTYTEVPATGHDFGEWTVVKAPTAAEAGTEERTCAVCKEKETRAVPELTPEQPAYTPGDVDGDGEVASGDARLALRASVKLESYAPGSAPFLAADADGNGVIESSDARLILRASVKLETLPAKP